MVPFASAPANVRTAEPRSIAGVVPAAGRSSRFGGMKLLADVDGQPLLNRTLSSLIEAGVAPVVVAISQAEPLDAASLMGHANVRTVVNRDPSRGMFSSIQCGIAVAKADVIVLLPADMPFVKTMTVSLVGRTCLETGRVVVPVFNGRRGHPIGIPGNLRDGLLMMPPDRSLKDALAALGEELLTIEVEDEGVLRDVDVQSDLYR
jgi:molybdenum cofactor cytidylyltransferase